MTQIKTVVILSGGQDSTTSLYWAINQWHGPENVAAVTFDYGQRHKQELVAACQIADMAKIASHEVVLLGPILKSTSPLTNPDEKLETYNSYAEMDKIIGDRIEKTFVPMRNSVFLTIAANHAVALGCNSLVTGVCQMDNANYPDCREGFLYSQVETINKALGNEVETFQIYAPLLWLSKAESIALALGLPGCMEALAYSHTAYDGGYPPTSRDHASVLRAQGFLEAGVPDPLVVRAWREGLMRLPDTANYSALQGGATGGP
jgi:7-cyano-7-deazaguanine synthase